VQNLKTLGNHIWRPPPATMNACAAHFADCERRFHAMVSKYFARS
jgi:hypothetical protein